MCDELRHSTRLPIIEVQPHHSTSPTTSLIEGKGADQLPVLTSVHENSFKVAVFVYKYQHGTGSHYLADELCRLADVQGRSLVRSASLSQLVVRRIRRAPLLVISPSWLPALASGTTYRSMSLLLLRCKSSKSRLKTHLFMASFSQLFCTEPAGGRCHY